MTATSGVCARNMLVAHSKMSVYMRTQSCPRRVRSVEHHASARRLTNDATNAKRVIQEP